MIDDEDTFDPVPLALAVIACSGIGLVVIGFLAWVA